MQDYATRSEKAQVTAAVRVARGFAVPVVGPVPPVPALAPGLICAVVGWDRDFLPEPQSMPPTVEALERHEIAADLAHQVSQQGQRQPHRREVGAAVADDARHGAQVPSLATEMLIAPPFLA